MAPRKKNYYRVLGVSPKEGEAAIRKAYREKAKMLHPDRAGRDSTARFQEIAEAYEVLSRPDRREEYDRALEAVREENRQRAPGAGRRVRPEPLVPERRHGRFSGPGFRVPPGERLGGFWEDGLAGGGIQGSREFEVHLSRHEAQPGSVIEIDLPRSAACRFCGGSGRDWLFPCMACLGGGFESSPVRLFLRVTGFVRDGASVEISPAPGGFESGTIRLRFRVA
jgi:molecular chaperone DnaJ